MAYANPVLLGSIYVCSGSKSVQMDPVRIEELAKQWATEKLEIPDWRAPVLPDNQGRDPSTFPDGQDKLIIDFLGVGTAIDSAFTNFETGEKYKATFNGVTYSGAYGMWGAFMRSLSEGEPINDGAYLAKLTKNDAKRILERDGPIPLFEDKYNVLVETGEVLVEKFEGHFYNLLRKSEKRVFNNGNGVVELLVSNFPSFDDFSYFNHTKVSYNKRAQLLAGLLQGKFLGTGVTLFPEQDVRALTIFADYQVPRAEEALGMLVYSKALKEKIEAGKLIPKDSKEENEIRANAIVAAFRLGEEINKRRSPENQVNALHMDYKLWSEGRKIKEGRHHLTKTTAY